MSASPHQSHVVFTLLLRWTTLCTLACVATAASAQSGEDRTILENRVDILRGQLQVGGPYAGVEFHHSRPLPSRVSFYYPVANSIDLATDYWKRDRSMPFALDLSVDGERIPLGEIPSTYRATPAWAVFETSTQAYGARVSYRFAESLPLFVLDVAVRGAADRRSEVTLESRMRPVLRTSHAYDFKEPTRTEYGEGGRSYRADYDDAAADSATVFIMNAASAPSSFGSESHDALFSYRTTLEPGDTLHVVQLIGSCRPREFPGLSRRAMATWEEDVARYEQRVLDYALAATPFSIGDPVLRRTDRWSRAILAANRHYLDGRMVPMPTPAQYNFFFTHDLLLTDLGAVFFDSSRVGRDLRYLADLAAPDSLLPHAYYWRNGEYVTEYAGSDNWNHLWFILLSASYLRHSGDRATVERLLPMIRESMRLMRSNESDGLMYSERPDWWDIGHVYGARSYLTTLMIRALRAYVYLSLESGVDAAPLKPYLDLAEQMQGRLVSEFWDDDAGYLLNQIDSTEVDRHYYSGSLLAAAFGLLDNERRDRLLETARTELLDENIGIRNAMPPDFLDLGERYRFNGPEVGAPYRYMNGGVWPQGIAWYALGLLAAGQPDSARAVLARYLTLDGVARSPGGQPALFEYRNTDRAAADYGEIDKTTFLWAGGWYLHVLYQLAGLREDEWNLWFSPDLPDDFGDAAYEIMMHGRHTRVSWQGAGRFFREIRVDGRRSYSAVVTAPADEIVLELGEPAYPYLARASAPVRSVDYDPSRDVLLVGLSGVPGMNVEIEVVSATPVRAVEINGSDVTAVERVREAVGALVTSLAIQLPSGSSSVAVHL